MTSSDLSASAKPWDIQVQTVKVIFEEFYQQGNYQMSIWKPIFVNYSNFIQGDAERAAGRQPISMMDRQQPHQQASSQVGFLNGICIPCYTLMYQLIPETKPLLDMCQENLRRWQQIDKQVREQQQKYPQIE